MNSKSLVPLSGVVAVALIIASFLLGGEPPDTDAPVDEVVDFYTENDGEIQGSSGLLALGALFFLFFSTNVAGVLRRAQGETGGSSALSFAGGILFAVGATIFAGIGFTLGDAVDELDASAVQTLHVMNMNMFFPIAVGTAAFFLGSGIATVKTGALPKWLGWIAIVLGIIAVTPVGFAAFMALGLWTVIVSVMLAMRAGSEPAGPAGPA
jgi:hypothetical protein